MISHRFMSQQKVAKGRLVNVVDELDNLKKKLDEKDKLIKKLQDEIFELTILQGDKSKS